MTKAGNTSRRLNRRLLLAFVVQIVLISATAIVGVYLAEFAIRELLIVSALESEADYFWARANIDPETPAPNTHTLIGYVFDSRAPQTHPAEFQGLTPGIHDLTTPVGQSVVHVSDDNNRRLYLVFDAENIRNLATYFGLVPLALLLIVLYSSAWTAYRIAGRAISPLIRLARDVRDLDLEAFDGVALSTFADLKGADDEVLTLAHALEQLVERVNQFVERERIFTRETSHELRSPLTVIKIASEMLLASEDLNLANRNTVNKIRRSVQDMEELTQAFLLLARESESGLSKERINLNQIVNEEMTRCEMIYGNKEIALELIESGRLWVMSSPKIPAVIVGNLMRNACAYTERGHVRVTINDKAIRIADSGAGMSDEQIQAIYSPHLKPISARESGHGIGLNLVKRLTDRFGWSIEISSRPGFGTIIDVQFPGAEYEPETRSNETPSRSHG